MKRPLLLLLAIAVVATVLTLLVMRISEPPESAETGASADATRGGPESAVDLAAVGAQAADLVAPGTDAAARAASEPATDETGPALAIEGRVMPPSGCIPDATVEVIALRRSSTIDAALAELYPRGKRAQPWINALDGSVREDVAEHAHGKSILARSAVGADGSYRLEVPASVETAHVIAVGRSWHGRATEEIRIASAPRRLDLVTHCGAWVEGTVTVPAGRDASALEGLRVDLESSLEGLQGEMRSARFVGRSARVVAGTFEFRALEPAPQYDVSADPGDLAAEKVASGELVAGRGTPVVLAFRNGGTLRGIVRTADGAPIAQAVVSANQKGRWFGFDDRSVRSSKSRVDGSFELTGVAAGKVDLKATSDGWLAEKPTNLDVVDAGVIDGIVLELGRGASISGTLHWADGRPAVDQEVEVEFDRSQMVAGMGAFNMLKGAKGDGKTDTEGRFVVTGLGPGPFVVEARGLPPELAQDVGDRGGKEWKRREHRARAEHVKPGTTGLALVLTPPTGVPGRVVDASGQPVLEFTIRANGVGEGMLAEVGQEEKSQTFDTETGAFLLPGLHAGKWKLRAESAGFSDSAPVEFQIPLAEGAPEFVITLERAAMVRGVVRSPEGALVVGATVSIDDGSPPWMRAMSRTAVPEAKSGSDGKFELGGLRPGSAALVALHEEHARSAPLVLELAAGQVVEDVALSLTRGGRITGEVFHEGKPAAGMMVQVQELKRFAQRMTTTDTMGRFEVLHVDAGTYQVVAMPMAGSSMTSDEGEFDPMSMISDMKMTTTEVSEGSDVHLVLGAPPEDPVKVTGTVTMAGAPVASATVMFLQEGSKMTFKPARTAKDGTYSITLDGPGGYSVSVQRMLSVQMDSQSMHEERRVIPKEPECTVDLTLPEGRISGRVLDADGKPSGNTRISVVREGDKKPGTMWGGQFNELRTNDAGEYDATGIQAGTYAVMAGGMEMGGMLGESSAAGGREIKSGIAVGEKDWRQGVDFRLRPPAMVEISVIDDAGRPVSGAVIFARDENGRALDAFSFVTTDASGLTKYGGLSAGSYTFRARTTGASTADSGPVRVEEGGKSAVKLALEKSSMLLVKVVDGEKLPLIAAVEVLDEHGRDVSSQLGLSEVMERFQGGGFDPKEQKFGPFPPGKYKVRVTSESGKTTTKTVSLNGQAERRVTIEV